jgi:hypothetical protein
MKVDEGEEQVAGFGRIHPAEFAARGSTKRAFFEGKSLS